MNDSEIDTLLHIYQIARNDEFCFNGQRMTRKGVILGSLLTLLPKHDKKVLARIAQSMEEELRAFDKGEVAAYLN
jgi:hypothetical protein